MSSNSSLLFAVHALAFLAAGVLFVVKAPAALRLGGKLKPAIIFLLAATVAYGVWMRFDHAPRKFKTFYVEYEAYNASRMIAGGRDFTVCNGGTFEKCDDRQQMMFGSGLPFLGAAAMKLTGKHSPNALFALNAILGVLCIPAVFILTMAGTGNARSALFASFAAAILPLNVIMSGNATSETADLLFLCAVFSFVFMYLRDRDGVSGVGIFAASLCSVLIEPRNIYNAAFILIILLAAKPSEGKRLAGVIAGAALFAAVVFVLPYLYRSALALPPGDFIRTVITNLLYIASNKFVPVFVTAPLVLAPVFLSRRCGVARPLFFFPFIVISALALFRYALPLGDFPRLMLPAAVSLTLFFGVAADWVLDAIKNAALRNGAIALCLAVFLTVSFNTSLFVMRDFGEAQDDFISSHLPKVAGNCSVYAANASVGMTYTKNPSYEMTKLLDGAFVNKHPECKVVVIDMSCATNMKKDCQNVYKTFWPKPLFIENILGYYKAVIGYIPATSMQMKR